MQSSVIKYLNEKFCLKNINIVDINYGYFNYNLHLFANDFVTIVIYQIRVFVPRQRKEFKILSSPFKANCVVAFRFILSVIVGVYFGYDFGVCVVFEFSFEQSKIWIFFRRKPLLLPQVNSTTFSDGLLIAALYIN